LRLGVFALNSTPHPACATFSPVKAEKEFELSRRDFFVSLWRNAAE
jgi:hypothetical protein